MELKALDWTGLYRADHDLWSPESYKHPARMAPALCFAILTRLEELGLLTPGATVLDFMSGIGTTGAVASVKDYRFVGIELEPNFVALQEQNRERLSRKLGRTLDWTVIQGDARNLSGLLRERGVIAAVSPPYVSGGHHNDIMRSGGGHAQGANPEYREGYGTTPGQIGALPDRICATVSPPYEDAINSATKGDNARQQKAERFANGEFKAKRPDIFTSVSNIGAATMFQSNYGTSDGQIGQERGESYADAMLACYREAAKVADVIVTVTKNPTRAGKLRRLDQMTSRLLRQVGWRIVEYHRAVLFEETESEDLFGETHRKLKGRVSFFKRLSWQKGSPVAAWEDILIAVRGTSTGVCATVSPPYAEAQTGGGIMRTGYSPESPSGRKRHPDGKAPVDWVSKRTYCPDMHGNTPGQIGNLKDRE